MNARYNEIDPFAAQWIRNLVAAGHVVPGEVDERSIAELRPADVAGPGQRHFFAGIAVWSYALRLAGVADDASVWTGSCPCQPFSDAGAGRGFDDPRHLWPAWFSLIRECRPAVVFGEQVASRAGLDWFASVRADLESAGYRVAAADLCAAGIGAPHIRQRLYFGAVRLDHAEGERCSWRHGVEGDSSRGREGSRSGAERSGVTGGEFGSGRLREELDAPQRHDADGCGALRRLGDAEHAGLEGQRRHEHDGHQPGRIDQDATRSAPASSAARRLGNSDGDGGGRHARAGVDAQGGAELRAVGHSAFTPGDADWLYCRDGKWRPVEPGTFPLAHGAASRVGRLRAYGNAIHAPLAAQFVRSFLVAAGLSREG